VADEGLSEEECDRPLKEIGQNNSHIKPLLGAPLVELRQHVYEIGIETLVYQDIMLLSG
jgi:hypothetical protein